MITNVRCLLLSIALLPLGAISMSATATAPTSHCPTHQAIYPQLQTQGLCLWEQLTPGALVRGQLPAGSKLWLDEQAVKVNGQGYFAFGFDRDAKLEHSLSWQLPPQVGTDSRQQQVLQLTPRQYKIQQVTGIAKKIMQPDPKDVARATLDSQQVNRARAIDSDGMAFVSEFMWPLQGRISGVYGSQRVYNGEPGRPHFGVDIAAPRGTKAMAPADGVVTLAVPDMFYSGGTLIVDHGNGVNSTFLHLDKLLVNVGQSIKQGEVIALVGSTGRSTGPHLDWRLNWFNTRLDPATIVPAMTKPTAKSKAKS